MHHQDVLRGYLVELRQRPHRATADVHEGLRFEQVDFMPVQSGARNLPVKLLSAFEVRTMHMRKFVHPPETGVVARRRIFAPGVAQPDD